MKVEIRGHSDDIIEVDGDIWDEFYPDYGKWGYLHFDDGTVIGAGYDIVPGKGWAVEVICQGVGSAIRHEDPVMDGDSHYSDRLVVEGDFAGVQLWSSPDGPTRDDLDAWFEEFDMNDYTTEQLAAAHKALTTQGDTR